MNPGELSAGLPMFCVSWGLVPGQLFDLHVFGFVGDPEATCGSGAPAELRKRVAGLVPPAGHTEHGNGYDLRFSVGQLIIEADYQL